MFKLLLSVVSIINFSLGVIVLRNRSVQQRVRYSFVIFSFITALWVFVNLMTGLSQAPFWVWSMYSTGALLSTSALIWVSFLVKKTIQKLHFIFIVLCGIIFFCLSYTPLIIYEIRSVTLGGFEGEVGPLFSIYTFYIAGTLIITVFRVINKFFHSFGIEKTRFLYVTFGVIIFASVSLIGSFILPIFGTLKFLPFDTLSSVIFLFLVTYAIIRYRLMNVKRVITRSLLFSLVVLIISSAFTAGTLLASRVFDKTDTGARIGVNIAVAIIVVLFLNPIKNFLAKITDKIFFKGQVDYQMVTQRMSDLIAATLERDQLLGTCATTLANELKIKKNTILFCNSALKSAVLYYSNQPSQNSAAVESIKTHLFNEYSSIISFFTEHTEIKVREEEERKAEDLPASDYQRELTAIVRELEARDISVVVPVLSEHGEHAFVFLSDKQSGDIYDNRDINLLELLRSQLTSALEKSRLYEDVKQFNIRLRLKVKEATAKLRVANSHLRELDKAKTLFLSVASHQLRTPLAGIKGFLSMILDGDFGELQKQVREILEDVYANSNRLIRLVNTFLNVSRIEAGRISLMRDNHDLVPMGKKVVNELQFTAQDKGLALTFETNKDEIVANVDLDKIEDVVINLTDNAIKYTAAGTIIVRLIDKGDKVRIEVQDTGEGLEAKEIKTLFHKFVRGERGLHTHTDGSGLGLYIAKRVAEMHNGEIGVTSDGIGKGCIFWFEVGKG